jgi:hypothetical protein
MTDLPKGYALTLFVVLFLTGSFCYANFTVDDAFITFRYGYNLVNHGIWNWNPDNDLVEAYTSGLYAALSILPHAFHIPVVLFFKLIGLSCLLWFLWRVWSGIM